MGKKKGKTMQTGLIKAVVDMLKSLSDLTKKVIDAGDPEKYASSVEQLHAGVSDSYQMMRNIVENDNTLSTDEKIEKLKQLAAEEEEAKTRCGEALQGNRERVAQISLDVLKGFLTCGLSFAPAIVQRLKDALSRKGEDVELIDAIAAEEPVLLEQMLEE